MKAILIKVECTMHYAVAFHYSTEIDMSVEVIVEKLPEKANSFDRPERSQCKFTLKSCSTLCPLTKEQCKKFSSTVLPPKHEQFLDDIRNLTIYDDDTWVISYPKCGTTWTQEAVWQICNGVDLTSERSKESLRTRFPFFEASSLMPDEKGPSRVEKVQQLSRPRFIKSHLPICFLPEKLWNTARKIVYVARDPKDAAVSYYHHYYNLHMYQGSIGEFCELYLNGMVEYGNYWDHVEQYNCINHLSNVKLIKYEDLKHNLRETLLDLSNFLEKPLSETKLIQLCEHLQFDKMKVNPAVNYSLIPPPHADETRMERNKKTGFDFIRRGQTGSHIDEMPDGFIERFDKQTNDRFRKYSNLY